MTYEPRFSYTNEIARDLMDIEGARRVVDVLPLPPDAAFLLRYEAQRNATHYSTSIEGNSLTLEQVPRGVAEADRTGNEQQQEVRNYWRALEWLEQQVESGAPLTEDFVRRLHWIIIVRGKGRRGEKSDYRTEECPVVDRATGQIDYGPPRPDDVPELMTALIAWRGSAEAAALPAPIRAGILAYQFVTIHPFGDGNGRTTRALATAELWLSGYRMRGFLSLEEHYYRDLQRYYDNLQMGLDPDYYLGRNDPDLTPWLSYFVQTMAAAARSLSERALALRESAHPPQAPWEQLDRRSQQLLSRVMLASRDKPDLAPVTIRDVETWFMVAPRTARSWLKRWHDERVLEPATGTTRVTAWRLTTSFATIVNAAIAAMGGTE